MDALLQIGLSNALMATVLALLAAAIGRLCRRPALVHGLWLLVLIKFITPSFVACQIPWREEPKQATVRATALPAQNPLLPSPRTPVESAQEAETKPDASEIAESSAAATLPAAELLPVKQAEFQPTVNNLPDSISAVADGSKAFPVRLFAFSLIPALMGIWLAGSISWFTVIAYRVYCFQRLVRHARPASADLREQVRRLAERLGLASCPALWVVPGRLSPMVWALGNRPRLLVPSALWLRLSQEQQATLLVHELAHLRRRDQWVRALELLVTGLYWWHPVVWWACREIHEAEEQCCDAWVVWTLPRAARAYATALLETIDFLSESQNALPAVASGIGHVHDLRRRLTMIMHGTTPRALSGAGILVVLGLGAFLLPLRPTWAQVEEPRDRRAAQEAEEQRRVAEERQAQAESAHREATRAQFEAQREKFQAERQALQQEMERAKAQFEKAMQDFGRRMAQLREQEQQAARAIRQADRPQNEAPRPRGASERSFGRERAADTEARLAELEMKLGALLEEVQGLRREMRRPGQGVMPSPGGPRSETPPLPGTRRRSPEGQDRPRSPRPPVAPAAAPPTAEVPPTPARPGAPRTAPAAPAVPPAPAGGQAPFPSPVNNPDPRPVDEPAVIER